MRAVRGRMREIAARDFLPALAAGPDALEARPGHPGEAARDSSRSAAANPGDAGRRHTGNAHVSREARRLASDPAVARKTWRWLAAKIHRRLTCNAVWRSAADCR